MADLYGEALSTFDVLFDEALAAGEPDRTAMVVATATLDARPSARTVLLKSHDARGFVFYTHLDGRKGRELQANPHAALLFHWPRVRHGRAGARGRQCRNGVGRGSRCVFRLASARQPARRVGVEAIRDAGVARGVRDAAAPGRSANSKAARCRGPPRWTGFRVKPERIEFWYGAEFRLHERDVYERDRAGEWSKRMLYP